MALRRRISRSSRLQARSRSGGNERCSLKPRLRPASRGFNPRRELTLQKNTALAGGIFLKWWRRRESNPRPEALVRQFYMRSAVFWI